MDDLAIKKLLESILNELKEINKQLARNSVSQPFSPLEDRGMAPSHESLPKSQNFTD